MRVRWPRVHSSTQKQQKNDGIVRNEVSKVFFLRVATITSRRKKKNGALGRVSLRKLEKGRWKYKYVWSRIPLIFFLFATQTPRETAVMCLESHIWIMKNSQVDFFGCDYACRYIHRRRPRCFARDPVEWGGTSGNRMMVAFVEQRYDLHVLEAPLHVCPVPFHYPYGPSPLTVLCSTNMHVWETDHTVFIGMRTHTHWTQSINLTATPPKPLTLLTIFFLFYGYYIYVCDVRIPQTLYTLSYWIHFGENVAGWWYFFSSIYR